MEWAPKAGEIGKALVYRVLLDSTRIASHDGVHAGGEEGIGFIVCGDDHYLRVVSADLVDGHAACETERLGFICHRRGDATLRTGDDRLATECRIHGYLAGSKKAVAINVQNGTRTTLTPAHGEKTFFHVFHSLVFTYDAAHDCFYL